MTADPFENLLRQIAARELSLEELIPVCAQLIADGTPQRAELLYRLWIGFNPQHPQAFAARFNRALILELVGDARAEEEYRKVLTSAPGLTAAAGRLAALLGRQGRPEAGLAVVLDAARGLTGELAHLAHRACAGGVPSTSAGAALKEAAAALDALARAQQHLSSEGSPQASPGPRGEEAADPAPPVLHPLLRMRDLYDAASALLCEPLTASGLAQLHDLVAVARTITAPSDLEGELRDWFTHYALAVEAVAPEAFTRTASIPDLSGVWATSTGGKISLATVRRRAHGARAEMVFSVAADPAYVALYGRSFLTSVLANLDVEALVVVHVIGGAGRLKAIAADLAIEDRRLVFSGDDFDPDQPFATAHDTPPKGRLSHPAAQYQSVRFLRLSGLLEAFGLPVVTSDIDLILQRGVKDLIRPEPPEPPTPDLLLNENRMSGNAGSRLTANLCIVFPTPQGRRYAQVLKSYLEAHLARPEVSRWIDQFALLMALQALRLEDAPVTVGWLDTEKDINNVIFPSYRPNPFRFLSLYHGFDLSSLAAAAQPPRAA